MYRVFLTEEYERSIKKISHSEKDRIGKKVSEYMSPQLKTEPHFGLNIKKLRGYVPEVWRYRIGDFRIFYHIDEIDRIVKILSIDQRKDAYR